MGRRCGCSGSIEGPSSALIGLPGGGAMALVAMDDDAVAEADLADPNPDVGDLFKHYDSLYFRGALVAAGFTVQWRSSFPNSSFGSCTFSKQQNTISLSESKLKYRSCADRKNALLHQMIHAIIYVKHHRKDRNHGPTFRAWMDAINSCCVQDQQRPDGGYNITTRHDFSPEEPHSLNGIVWKCGSCGDTLLRAKNQGPPSDACCIENDDTSASCENMLCYWHNHKTDCSGTYKKTMLKLEAQPQKKVAGGAQLQPTEDNGKPQGSSSSKKADKRRTPEMVGGTSVLPATPQGKPNLNHGLVATVKQVPGSNTSKKAEERHELQIAQKARSQSAKPHKRLKQDLVALKKKELSPLIGYNNKKLLDMRSSKKAYRQHEPEDIQETTVLPTAPGIKPKASIFVASEKQRKGKCKRKTVKEKDYAVMSAWLNYYESDRSSGSTEPLVNKRTERRRRKREGAKVLTYSRSKKIKTEPSVNSRTYASVSSHKIERAPQDESMQQLWLPSPCSDHAVDTTADQVVVTPATGDQLQLSAPCLDVVPFLQPADPLTSPDQSTALDIIVISDDD